MTLTGLGAEVFVAQLPAVLIARCVACAGASYYPCLLFTKDLILYNPARPITVRAYIAEVMTSPAVHMSLLMW